MTPSTKTYISITSDMPPLRWSSPIILCWTCIFSSSSCFDL